jgi:DNA-binding MarR family transcriptional regulator
MKEAECLWASFQFIDKLLGGERGGGEVKAFLAICANEGIMTQDLNSMLGESQSTTSKALKKLTERGLIECVQSRVFRNRLSIRLTPQGKEILNTYIDIAYGDKANKGGD